MRLRRERNSRRRRIPSEALRFALIDPDGTATFPPDYAVPSPGRLGLSVCNHSFAGP